LKNGSENEMVNKLDRGANESQGIYTVLPVARERKITAYADSS
jgi:hypothetical protein